MDANALAGNGAPVEQAVGGNAGLGYKRRAVQR